MDIDITLWATWAERVSTCALSAGGGAAVAQLINSIWRRLKQTTSTPEELLKPWQTQQLLAMYGVVCGKTGYTDDERKRLLAWAIKRTPEELSGLCDGTLVARRSTGRDFITVRSDFVQGENKLPIKEPLLNALFPALVCLRSDQGGPLPPPVMHGERGTGPDWAGKVQRSDPPLTPASGEMGEKEMRETGPAMNKSDNLNRPATISDRDRAELAARAMRERRPEAPRPLIGAKPVSPQIRK